MRHSKVWYSERVQRHVRLTRWGHYGMPVLLFPTAGGDAGEAERMQLIGALWELIESGRIKVYSCDSVWGEALLSRQHSPLHYLPDLDDGWQLDTLRQRMVLMAMGEGQWENPSHTWNMARVLGDKGIPNRVDSWGPTWPHDWPTWRQMLPGYLTEFV
jgi:esterase/lipase superfamily enzyme